MCWLVGPALVMARQVRRGVVQNGVVVQKGSALESVVEWLLALNAGTNEAGGAGGATREVAAGAAAATVAASAAAVPQPAIRCVFCATQAAMAAQ